MPPSPQGSIAVFGLPRARVSLFCSLLCFACTSPLTPLSLLHRWPLPYGYLVIGLRSASGGGRCALDSRAGCAHPRTLACPPSSAPSGSLVNSNDQTRVRAIDRSVCMKLVSIL